MSQQELVRLVIQVLKQAEVDYMVTGSLVSSLQGEPRATHDIDIVINLPVDQIAFFLQQFPAPDFYLSEDAVNDAVHYQSMFNLLSTTDGEKVDFWILTGEAFDQSRFSRKRGENVMGIQMNVSSPEDTILMKLKWCALCGGSDKQYKDALRVFEIQREQLDVDYLNHWVNQLNVEALWQKLQSEAEEI